MYDKKQKEDKMTIILELLGILLVGLGLVLYTRNKRKRNIKNRFYGIKVGVVVMKFGANDKDTFIEGFIKQEFINKGAKVAPIILRSLKNLPEIENLKEITLYQKKFDFLVAGELKTESKIKSVFAPHLNKNTGQKIIYLSNSRQSGNKFSTIVKYTLNFKIFSFDSRSYVGEGCVINSKFLNDPIQPVFKKMAENLVNSICVSREGHKHKGVLVEVKNNLPTNDKNDKEERTQK